MTDAELELAILRKYVEHYDSVGANAVKCQRELDMRQVIAEAIGRTVDDGIVARWHARLAPQSPPYPAGVLRQCSDSTANKGAHRFHARAYYEPGKAPAWERIQNLEQQLPDAKPAQKEKEQKFGILNSPGQAMTDFALYSSERNADTSMGVIFLDIDNFKGLNGKFTESMVDRDILVPFQQLLHAACRHRGDAYRHGGEEFVMLLPNQTQAEVTQFAERLRQKIETQQFSAAETLVRITVSIGIAFWPTHGEALQEVIEKANRAEHVAKSKGKNRVEIYNEQAA